MRLRRFDQINVVPFIDIMLVLLVIVLTTATFIAKGVIPLDLPKAGSAKELPIKQIEISINKDGRIYYQKDPITLDQLQHRLEKLSKKSHILLRTDKESRFEQFVKVLDILKQRGFESIDLETER